MDANNIQPETQPSIVEVKQSEYVEVTRNSKGYNYSVKLLEVNLDKLKEKENGNDMFSGVGGDAKTDEDLDWLNEL